MADNYTPRVKAILTENGCTFVRQGKGDHEIWHSPITMRRLMVDSFIKSRHWANYTLTNYTLKQAGLPKLFDGRSPWSTRDRRDRWPHRCPPRSWIARHGGCQAFHRLFFTHRENGVRSSRFCISSVPQLSKKCDPFEAPITNSLERGHSVQSSQGVHDKGRSAPAMLIDAREIIQRLSAKCASGLVCCEAEVRPL
jgi:hypothetical protein